MADVDLQHKEAKDFFLKAANGEFHCFTSTIVFFEVYWVVLGQFKDQKDKTIGLLNKLLQFHFIEIENVDLISKALGIYEQSNLGLVDCFNLVYAKDKKASGFKTFDKALIRKLFS
mgnify:FL=1